MKTPRHRFTEWLAVTGFVGLALLAIPVIAILAFVLRAALMVAVAAGLTAGVALWLTSARFRAWLGTGAEPEVLYKGMRLATDVAVHPGHAWTRRSGRDVIVGADDLLPVALGPIESVELPPAGRRVVRGEVLFRMRRGDRSVDVRAPVSGTVAGRNDALADAPRLVNEDPFNAGWAVRLRGVADAGHPRRGQDARAWFRGEVDRLLAAVLGDVAAVPAMADGGVVAGDLHRRIDDRTWRAVMETLGGANR